MSPIKNQFLIPFRKRASLLGVLSVLSFAILSYTSVPTDDLKEAFKNPPDSSKPGVYWYFMDGNLSREAMTKDLESMKEVGISNLIFLEVGIGVPRGPIDFMSSAWQDLYVHAVRESERLGIKILLGAGPGWCGSGGPWVKPGESMKHLVFSETEVLGDRRVEVTLPMPEQRSTTWHKMKDPYYEDVAVYAIPNSVKPVISDINEKALFERDPYSSKPNVKPFLPDPTNYPEVGDDKVLKKDNIINITDYLQPDGQLVWDAPAGQWTIIRLGKRVTGASTRPSPEPVIGLESNKMDSVAFKNHLKNYTDLLLEKTAPRKEGAGWTGFHMDSWESGAQNWTEGIVEEFTKRRGYDPEPYLLAYTGRAIKSIEITERFLWDLRQTCKELVLENHVEFAKAYAHKNGLELTIEPYDMNPAGDLDLGAISDVIMAEFWSKRFGYVTWYAVLEATSISHITGQPIVGAEVFTSNNNEAWQEYPWSMKDQSDWAVALGVNRFVYHTFAHKPLGDEHRPGMTMGGYGVHWDRGQTWWPMVEAYHKYISRCSHMMQQGQAVSDILYLTPEGAPMVFTPPADALQENGAIPDKKGYGFDGCSPKMLMERAVVEKGKIVFPGGSSYEIMVLPNFKTMTPELLQKITSLVEKGAKIIGAPPEKSPSLMDYPSCDNRVKSLAEQLWGSSQIPKERKERRYGQGTIYWGGNLGNLPLDELYPTYENTIALLSELHISEDFRSANNTIRSGHRKTKDRDIYFVANRTGDFQNTSCTFRAVGEPELWIGATGETRKITNYTLENGLTTIQLEFFPYESFFIIFSGKSQNLSANQVEKNFPVFTVINTIEGSWDVSFNTKFGGPENIKFDRLSDWTEHEMRGIKYYSGIANYKKTINIEKLESKEYYLDLGVLKDIARVKLNGQDMGVIWCAPWRIDISSALQAGSNYLEIEVANRWINRLLGDQQEPDANVRTVKFENGLMGGQEFTTGRYTFTTKAAMSSFKFTAPPSSGLLGPVRIMTISEPKINPPAGRVAIVADGNSPDPDDLGGTAVSIALLRAAGLEGRLVHYSHSCDLVRGPRISEKAEIERHALMQSSCDVTARRWGGFESLTFFDAKWQKEETIQDLCHAINASSADDPLWIVEAGEPDIIGLALEATPKEKHKYIKVVTHHPANDNAGDFYTWQQILDFGVEEVRIPDQNIKLKVDLAAWDWARDHPDSRIQQVWLQGKIAEVDNVVGFQKGKWDCSDAGMILYWITGATNGGLKQGTVDEVKTLLLDYIARNPDN